MTTDLIVNARSVHSPDGVPRLLLRPEEVAAALGISRARVYELLASGSLPSVRIGRSRRIPLDALRAWVAAQAA